MLRIITPRMTDPLVAEKKKHGKKGLNGWIRKQMYVRKWAREQMLLQKRAEERRRQRGQEQNRSFFEHRPTAISEAGVDLQRKYREDEEAMDREVNKFLRPHTD